MPLGVVTNLGLETASSANDDLSATGNTTRFAQTRRQFF
jgi:hypothetical protein